MCGCVVNFELLSLYFDQIVTYLILNGYVIAWHVFAVLDSKYFLVMIGGC